jgi:hypothetical protein
MRKHFHESLFNGFDFDPTMLRIGAMNMVLRHRRGPWPQPAHAPEPLGRPASLPGRTLFPPRALLTPPLLLPHGGG